MYFSINNLQGCVPIGDHSTRAHNRLMAAAGLMLLDKVGVALPSDILHLIISFLPKREFIHELRWNTHLCLWCQAAFNNRSREFITLLPIHYNPGRHEDADVDCWFTRRAYICYSCIWTSACRQWMQRDVFPCGSVSQLRRDWGAKVADAVARRPSQVSSFFEEWGMHQNYLFQSMGTFSRHFMPDHFAAESEGEYNRCFGCKGREIPPVRGAPIVRCRSNSVSVLYIVYVYGWCPQEWPSWVSDHPHLASLVSYSYATHMRVHEKKRHRYHPCMLHWPLSVFPSSLLRLVPWKKQAAGVLESQEFAKAGAASTSLDVK